MGRGLLDLLLMQGRCVSKDGVGECVLIGPSGVEAPCEGVVHSVSAVVQH